MNDRLLDAVQRYFFEIIDSGSGSTALTYEILDEMRAALYVARPEAAAGAPKPELPSVAAPVPEESVS